MNKRHSQILELLIDENRMEVTTLAQKLGVSQVTIRKDLDELEKSGLIVREHGSALLRSMDDINGRIAYHYEAKKEIAKKAASLVENGSTLMIESGSCCALLANELCECKRDLTIITNSAFIADYIRGKANFQIILLGGIYQPDAQVLVGPMIRTCVSNFCVDLFFLGTDGYSPKTGFTNRDSMRAQAVRDMAPQADNVVILTESEKLQKRGICPLGLDNSSITVITDSAITEEIQKELSAQSIKLITT